MSTCKNCKDNEQIPQQSKDELAFAFAERMVKRLWITTLILIFMLVGTNGAWLWWESQWETVESWEITQESDGGTNNYIGNDGDIFNGETDGQKD